MLKKGGFYTFNLNQQFYANYDKSHRKPVVDEICREIEKRGYPPEIELPEPITSTEIKGKGKQNNLEISETAEYSFKGASLEDSIKFFQIPAFTPIPEEVTNEEKREILRKVKNRLNPEDFPIRDNKWKYFKLEKK